jgi:hypothetical protein
MRKIKIGLFICGYLISGLSFAQTTNQQDSIFNTPAKDSAQQYNTLEITADYNYMQTYLWRAINFGSDNVMQPYVTLAYKNFFFQLASNTNVIPRNLPDELYSKKVFYDEQDFEIGYGNSFKKLDFEIKFDSYRYFFQPTSPSTSEFNVKLMHPLYKNLTAFSENVIDIEAYKGSYYNNSGLMYSKEIKAWELSALLCAGLGNKKFNETYYYGTSSGLFFGGSKIEAKYTYKSFYIRGMAEKYFYAKNDIKGATEKKAVSNFQIGIGRIMEFKFAKKSKKKIKKSAA